MFTVKGNIIDINGKTEWLLFHRLSKKINPVDFLALTDGIIQLPNFLFTISFFILVFLNIDNSSRFAIPAGLYFIGHILVNFRIGVAILKLLKLPLLIYMKYSFVFIAATLIASWFYLSWWTFMIIPVYLMTLLFSVVILTAYEKKLYLAKWKKEAGNYDIFKNNAFLFAYKFYAGENQMPSDTSPSNDETENQDWLKPYTFMRVHWEELESHFNRKAQVYWKAYLHLNK
jgi:hypothetical protein